MKKTVIIMNQKVGILSLPYPGGKGSNYQDFLPGKNEIDAEIFDAVKKANEKNWPHYKRHLKELSEMTEDAESVIGDGIDLSALTVNDAKTVIENIMSIEELEEHRAVECDGKKRTGVKDAIDAQIALLKMEAEEK